MVFYLLDKWKNILLKRERLQMVDSLQALNNGGKGMECLTRISRPKAPSAPIAIPAEFGTARAARADGMGVFHTIINTTAETQKAKTASHLQLAYSPTRSQLIRIKTRR